MTTTTAVPRKVTIKGPKGLRLVLDRDEVKPNDPGDGCPALVTLYGATGSLTCAVDTGTLDSERGDRRLTPAQMKWLESVQSDAWAFTEGDDMALWRLNLKAEEL